MHPILASFLLLIAAYAVGCANTGYYLVRFLRGKDLRALNSGSAGARNAARTLGKTGFILVFLGDAGKAALMMLTARYATALGIDARVVPWLVPALVAGHIWPAQLGFKGGKGLSSSAGAFLAVDYRVVVGFFVAHGIFGAGMRNPRAGLIAAILVIAPLAAFFVGSGWFVPSLLLSAMLLYAHRDNLLHPRAREVFSPKVGG
jgi:glycerol-3-phosphate acyltransferase PlsY